MRQIGGATSARTAASIILVVADTVVPLMLATGAGAEMRRALGTAVFSGMLGVTFFGIFLTPVFFYVIQWFGRQPPRRDVPASQPGGIPPQPETGIQLRRDAAGS
jgi:hypothetical protein